MLYSGMDGLAVGKAVEDQFAALHKDKVSINVEQLHSRHHDRYQSYHEKTFHALESSPAVLYQAWFVFDNLFVKTDFLVKNADGKYDLYEVKAKNSIHKKTVDMPLLEEIVADVSIQHFVLKKALWELYSGRSFVVYLNKDYVREWDIDSTQLLIQEDISAFIRDDERILDVITRMSAILWKPREEFIKVFPYSGEDHLTFFGTKHASWSLWTIPQIRNGKVDFVAQNKLLISAFTEEDRKQLFSAKKEETKASKYISLWQQAEKVVDKSLISAKFAALEFPLYFYDYETVSCPVPVLQHTKPRQQVVVQYSCHRLDADGTITHTQDIINPWEHDNSRVIAHLMQDLNNEYGTYIVWYKWFENTRNTEIAQQYPQYTEICERINNSTFDLMEIFSELHYFHREFQGSASIKKVLPVMTDISYANMAVPHWAMAADILCKIISGNYNAEEASTHIKNLLDYCTQDTRAMVRIYEELKREVKEE